ncbi:MAG: oligosaccharide flippase family protein [Bacteroidetes bacterium]|nr:oligosaccharide flippase family protein [Bacteroidota bacterium]
MLGKIFNTFSIKLASAICNLLIAIFVSRYLGAIGKGEQSIVLTTISFILIFVNIAGGATLVYLTPRFKISHLIFLSYVWSLFTAIAFYIILYFFNIVERDFVGHICLLSLINSYAAINSNILLGKEKVNASNLVNLAQPLFMLIALFSFFVFVKKADVISYIYSLYIAYFLSFLLSILLLKKDKEFAFVQDSNWKITLYAMFSFGFFNQLSHITSMLNARLSYYLLTKYKGADQLGIYSNGVSLTEAVWMVSGSMAMVQYARIANSYDKKYAQELTVNLTKISLLISIMIIIPMILLPSEFYSIIFGKEFVNLNYIMLCLAPGVILWNFSLLIGHYFSGTGKFYIEFSASSAALIVTLLLSFWAIPIWGFYGAGIISSISYLFNAIVILYFYKKESGVGFKKLLPQWEDLKLYVSIFKQLLFNKNKDIRL